MTTLLHHVGILLLCASSVLLAWPRVGEAQIPAIDAVQPNQSDTATFSLG